MRRRRGITLIEVLVAIFIMAIGLLAILTLFPLAAMRMGQALQADRAAAAASAGANICDAFGIRKDPEYDPPLSLTLYGAQFPLFATPPPPPPGMANLNLPPASTVGSGFPIYVDPYGVANNSGTLGYSAATSPATPGIWRVSPTVIPPPYSINQVGPPPFASPNPGPTAARYFSLPDDITFADNGQPDLSSGVVQRGGRYTYAYLLRRQNPYSTQALPDLALVVYAGRTTAVPGGENTYAAAGAINNTAVLLTWGAGQPAPNIRRGTWILDTSYNQATSSVHGDFYRVVTVSQPSTNVMNLELQLPLAKPLTAVTVLDNVVEVFERGADPSTHWEFRNEP
jgi:prepilin-type N-terminal cleavage/methylation domain-containing protein